MELIPGGVNFINSLGAYLLGFINQFTIFGCPLEYWVVILFYVGVAVGLVRHFISTYSTLDKAGF